jgi:predicted AAA+ superfamily ATPase
MEKIDIQKFATILKKLGFKEGTIVTSEEFGEETLDGIKIYIKPAWCTEFTFGF